MRIMVAHRAEYYRNERVQTYALSMIRVLREFGHSVLEVPKVRFNSDGAYDNVDLLLDLDCGRDETGNLVWHAMERKVPCKSAVYFIDSHGHPSQHHRIAPNYDHVFYAVWAKRDLFEKHKSAHWCPNFTDLRWFDGMTYSGVTPTKDFGFYGSKGGLDRAISMIKIANDNGWSYDVRQVSPGGKHRWPHTAAAMAECRNLFNHQQKHDGPNLRVMESMAMMRPLVCDLDPTSGMNKLFKPWVHYIPYESYTNRGLKEAMGFCMGNRNTAAAIAESAYLNVKVNHLVEHRITQILRVVNEFRSTDYRVEK